VAFALGWLEGGEPWRFERGGTEFEVSLPLEDPFEVGIVLEPDRPRVCPNHCVFCFVDQLPPGLRRSLYVKDEDFRLSFTCGTYVTLTNLDDDAYRRIERQRLSPLYVSVHATDDSVRRMMLGNPQAPSILPALARLIGAGIEVHAQIVVCPGLNDRSVLTRSLEDLASLGEGIGSVAVVPVGLTDHRDGLFPLVPLNADDAAAVIDAVSARDGRPGPAIEASDEIYLLAGRELPPYERYGEFPQIENGVGLLRLFEHELLSSAHRLSGAVPRPMRVALVTGTLAAPFLRDVAPPAVRRYAPVSIVVVPVMNRFLGPTVTVAGLLSGKDLVRGVRGAPDADVVLVPAEAFNVDGLTLDGMTVSDIAEAAGRQDVRAARDLIEAVLNTAGEMKV
jgi:putative radical SAM enzyme (TIGR03279 family)